MTQTYRYQVRLPGRHRLYTVHVTNDEKQAIRQAEIIGGKAFDTATGDVWSHQTQAWLAPITQDVIEGKLSEDSERETFRAVAISIAAAVAMPGVNF